MIITFLKVDFLSDFILREVYIFGRHNEFILDVVFAVSNADNSARIFFNRYIDACQVYVKLFTVSAEHSGNKAVINRVMKRIIFLFMYVSDRTVDFNLYGFKNLQALF